MLYFPAILVARNDFFFQIVGNVASREESDERIANYLKFGPELELLAPDCFELHFRDSNGFYTQVERIEE